MPPSVAILIDGGFFLKRLPSIQPFPASGDKVMHIVKCLDWLISGHLKKINESYKLPEPWAMLYRILYYDAAPYPDNAQLRISKRNVNFAISDEAKLRDELFAVLRRKRKFALRLGHVIRERGWTLKEDRTKALLAGQLLITALNDSDFELGLRQKGVDMRIGLDIASMAYKRQVDKIVLVSGDSDFVPAAKVARREGIDFILDHMWLNVSDTLFEHVDGTWNGVPKGNAGGAQGQQTP